MSLVAAQRVGIALFLIGLAIGILIPSPIQSPQLFVQRANNANFIYTNPLLSCGISENKESSEYTPLKGSINSLLEKMELKDTLVSVYYRDLTTGRWFAINENETYSPASLFKVSLMIAYLKDAESNPGILSKQIFYSGTDIISNDQEYYKPEKTLEKNRSYTVDELISAMIKYSDNTATDLLFKSMDQNSIAELMMDIGVNLPQNSSTVGTTDFLTVKSYSYLFRLLYNSTYLSREMSEKAMKLLSYSDFPQGITGGVPHTVSVAQKFGERTIYNPDGTILRRELHDCGIIYYPQHPYLLCVMTKGQDFEVLSPIIKKISTFVYQNVEAEYKK